MDTSKSILSNFTSPASIIGGGLFVFISSALIQKYLGLAGIVAYAAGSIIIISLAMKIFPLIADHINRHFLTFLALFALGLTLIFAIAYPVENGRMLGRGSDRDDGLNIATERLFACESPYYPANNPRAGPLSLLPGAILLAAPFKLLGNCSHQNIFWICTFVLVLGKHLRNRPLALLTVAIAFLLCPALQYEFISGGDMLANGIYVTLFLVWAAKSWSTPKTRFAIRLMTALALGIGLASRPNFILILPLLGGYLWQTSGSRHAIISCSITLAVTSAVTLPFYLYDPAGFSPLVAGNKLALLNAHYPGADTLLKMVLFLATLVTTLHLMLSKKPPSLVLLFRYTTMLIALPMILVVILFSFANGHADFSFMHPRYGLMYFFVGIFAWSDIRSEPTDSSICPCQ